MDEAPYSFEVTEHGQKISIDMANTKIKGKIVISKVDADTEELLPDAGFRIYDVNGEVIREGRTDKNGNVELNKIAARWPAKAVAQFSTFSKKGSDRIVPR